MRFIAKDYNTEAVVRHETELQSQQLDEQSLLDQNIHPGLTGSKLWKMVRDIKVIPHFWDLKHQMYDEQGGLCCYCGLRIYKDTEGRKQSVEHVIPKGTHRELVGEYKNLLLTCSVTQDDASILGVDSLSHPSLRHCDDSKDNVALHYSPLMSECEDVFHYDVVGNVGAANEDAKEDIDTLQLNCDLLKVRRKAALSILFDENNELITDEELLSISANIMSRDSENRLPEFCFVIKDVAESLMTDNK